MFAKQIKEASRLTEPELEARPSHLIQELLTAPSYQELLEFHLKRVAHDRNGNSRPKQSLDNERSVISSWVVELGLTLAMSVGEEMSVRFNESLADYVSALEMRKNRQKLSKQTISDRKSILRKLRESFIELNRAYGLPQDFSSALRCLVESAEISVYRLSLKIGVQDGTIWNWINGIFIPSINSLPAIRKLEEYFKIPEGALSSRLPEVIWTKAPARRCDTTWRSHQSTLLKLRYRMIHLSEGVQAEWRELVLFFTDDRWLLEHGLKRNSEWRIRWNNGKCPTAKIHLSEVKSFFGYLCLSTDNRDERLIGLGFNPQVMTLALLADADLVIKYLYFMKGRTALKSFNNATLSFLNFCLMLLRNKTGYLRQRPEFGSRMLKPVLASKWSTWCRENRLKLLEFRKMIIKSKRDGVRQTRNPFEPVIDLIKERQHPITALFDLTTNLEALIPLMKKGSRDRLAVHCRNIFLVRLLSSNPLRIENFSMMTFIPRNYPSFEKLCETYCLRSARNQCIDFSELYVETTSESNLYQRRDGSWHLRFNERDFKNEKEKDIERGVRHAPYDVAIVPSVWSSLVEYIFRHRALLNESLRNALRLARTTQGLPSLSSEEELAIIRCPYVFRTGACGAYPTSANSLSKGYGTGQIRAQTLSNQILTLTRKYLSSCKGFSAHACRHLVATEYIKNHPNGYEEAAIALHNTASMVRKHYSWVEIGDLIKPWSNYYEDLKEKYDKDEI